MFVPFTLSHSLKDLLPATWLLGPKSICVGEVWTILQKVLGASPSSQLCLHRHQKELYTSFHFESFWHIWNIFIFCHHWVISIMILIFIQLSWCQTLRILAIALILLSIIFSPITLTIIVVSWNFCPLASSWQAVFNAKKCIGCLGKQETTGFAPIFGISPGRRRRTNLQAFVKILLMMLLRWQLAPFWSLDST